MRFKTVLMAAAAAVALPSVSITAQAQEEDAVDSERKLQTITVEARKREESI